MPPKKKRQLKLGVAGTASFLSLVLLLRFFLVDDSTRRLIEYEWFYDVNEKVLFDVPRDTVPPIAAPSGATADGMPAGVKAYVYACGGDCGDDDKRFIAYLERFTDEARQTVKATNPDPMVLYKGHLVADPDEMKWELAISTSGQAIQAATARKCPEGEKLKPCYP